MTRLQINRNGRTTYNLHAEGNGMLTENERDILVDGLPDGATADQALAARSLIGAKRDLRGAVTVNRKILGDDFGDPERRARAYRGTLVDWPWRDAADAAAGARHDLRQARTSGRL